jgi:hypothetical protein
MYRTPIRSRGLMKSPIRSGTVTGYQGARAFPDLYVRELGPSGAHGGGLELECLPDQRMHDGELPSRRHAAEDLDLDVAGGHA